MIGELLPQHGVFPRPIGQQPELLQVYRLLHIIESAQLHGLDGSLDRAVGRHDDDRDGGIEFLDPPEQLDPAHPGKPHVGEHDVGPQALQQRQRLLAVPSHLGLIPSFPEKRLDGPRQSALVVHHQYSAAPGSQTAAPLGWATGSRTRTVVPPGRLSISSRPPFCSTYRLAIASPNPVPSCRVVKNGSQTEGITCSGIPGPVSPTSTLMSDGCRPLFPWADAMIRS